MNKVGLAVWCALLELPLVVQARGVSPYLPLNLEPEVESQIERVMILADEPVMSRPIAAATVLDALQKASKYDPELCARVRRYLDRYTHKAGITHASIEGATSSGEGKATVDPNRYGMEEDSHWDASAQAYWQPGSYLLVDAGAVAYEGHTDYTGSMVSLGMSYLQLDLGFRPHWFSPFTDSSMLMSTEAPTMPSVTLSNYDRFSPFRIHYELFAARMSNSNNIVFGSGLTAGHPRLAGLHLDMEPAEGWSLGVSRLLQYGGGALGGSSLNDLFKAFFNPSGAQTPSGANGQAFGNQEASVTSSLLFPGRVPFAFYVEYAGEDTSAGKDYLLGNTSLSLGLHFPKLGERFDLTLEATEWQNLWYVHNIYLDGLTNYHRVIGNWFGDQRVFGDGVGGHSAMIALGYEPVFGGLFQLRYRTLKNQEYTGEHYKTFQDFSLVYSRPWLNSTVGGEVDVGRDVFGQNFTRLSAFLRYDNGSNGLLSTVGSALSPASDSTVMKDGELFVDAGASANWDNVSLTAGERRTAPEDTSYHVALGARRFVSDHSDLGARLEADNVGGHNLLGARLLDYRYRFNSPLAFNAFLGAARYNLATPAYGFYVGFGPQWRNVIPGWDLSLDVRYAASVARDHLLPNDPPDINGRNDSFYNIFSTTFYISRHF